MVIYIKSSEEGEINQFTTALEAKEFVAANFNEAVLLSIQKEAAEDANDLAFDSYDNVDVAKEAIDAGYEAGTDEEIGADKGEGEEGAEADGEAEGGDSEDGNDSAA